MNFEQKIPTPRFTGIFIPVEILEIEELSALDQILLSWIHALYDKEVGGCFASNSYLAAKLKVKENTIVKSLVKFRKLGLVKDISFDGRKRVIKACIYDYIQKNTSHSNESYESHAGCDLNHMQGVIKITGRVRQKSHADGITRTYYSKEESKEENIAESRKNSTQQRPDFSFSFSAKKFENITENDMKNWKIAFSSIDIAKEILKAEQWLQANPTKSKKKLWRKFLIGWFTRANEKADNKAAYNSGSKFDRKEDSTLRTWEKDAPKDNWEPECPFKKMGIKE